jgi:mRNA-degrading endonuclease YafQ of YafQ-DinJ toxin-antitoxin module
MGYQLITTSHFERRLRRFERAHPALKRRITGVLRDLQEDPYQPRLRLHQLQVELAGTWAASITYTYRITLTLQISERRITLLDIGTHDEVYRDR